MQQGGISGPRSDSETVPSKSGTARQNLHANNHRMDNDEVLYDIFPALKVLYNFGGRENTKGPKVAAGLKNWEWLSAGYRRAIGSQKSSRFRKMSEKNFNGFGPRPIVVTPGTAARSSQ
jgi:hypothetical protein